MDLSHALITIALIAIALILRTLLDFEIAQWLVKWFYWLPTRWLYRDKPPSLDGTWEHIWNGDTSNFLNEIDRHGQHRILQFFRYCYAETISRGKVYVAFGRIEGDYLIGRWYDKKDKKGYFGAFQLYMKDSSTLTGRWIGHSKSIIEIRTGSWEWRKLDI